MITPVSRRLTWLLLLLMTTASPAERQLGTIGPPPRKDPQRETAAEGVPPLPLPATPLRRSEPKAEPNPPTFAARLVYGADQDYMPNPGDLDNLLRHVRAQIDAWYGHTVVKIDELVAMQKAGQTYTVPMIYMTGYDGFTFTSDQREALRSYLLDGGTLIATAALGSAQFNESFKSEMAAMFPQRRFDVLQLDHPIMRAYYKYANVHYFTITQGVHTRTEGPPYLMGLNIAARTAVILSPYDMTCGWDEFYAPAAPRRGDRHPAPTLAMLPEDAIRLGVNFVSYVSAERRFAKSQAETRPILGDQPEQRAAVTIAHLRHQGDWNADPNSLYQLIRLTADRTSVPIAFDIKDVDPVLEQIADTPIVLMTGMDEPQFTAAQIDVLRRHLSAGGFLFINNTSGFNKFDREARALIASIYPTLKLAPLPPDHPIYHGLYEIDQMRDAATLAPRPPELEAVSIDGRAVIVYSKNDTLAMLKGIHDPYANAYDADSARKLALNILTYAVGR